MVILVTGAAGFLGSHVVDYLLRNEYTVYAIDDLSRGSRANIKDHLDNPNFHFTAADTRTAFVKEDFVDQRIDYVLHFASIVGSVNLYQDRPSHVAMTNMGVDLATLQFCLSRKVSKLIYFSSGHVYPKILTRQNSSIFHNEEAAFPADPELSYGWAKLFGEIMCREATVEFPWFSAMCLRLVGIYGPGQDVNQSTASLIPALCSRILERPNHPLQIRTDGTETRTYLYITDFIAALEKVLNRQEFPSKFCTFNLSADRQYAVKDIASLVIEASGNKVRVAPDVGKHGDIRVQNFSSHKFSQEYNWTPKVPLSDGILLTYASMKATLTHS